MKGLLAIYIYKHTHTTYLGGAQLKDNIKYFSDCVKKTNSGTTSKSLSLQKLAGLSLIQYQV